MTPKEKHDTIKSYVDNNYLVLLQQSGMSDDAFINYVKFQLSIGANSKETFLYGMAHKLFEGWAVLKGTVMRKGLPPPSLSCVIMEPQSQRPYVPPQDPNRLVTDRPAFRRADGVEVGYPKLPGGNVLPPDPPIVLKVYEAKRAGEQIKAAAFQLEDTCQKALDPYKGSNQDACFAVLQFGDRVSCYAYFRTPPYTRTVEDRVTDWRKDNNLNFSNALPRKLCPLFLENEVMAYWRKEDSDERYAFDGQMETFLTEGKTKHLGYSLVDPRDRKKLAKFMAYMTAMEVPNREGIVQIMVDHNEKEIFGLLI
jgi:hypothetical protein